MFILAAKIEPGNLCMFIVIFMFISFLFHQRGSDYKKSMFSIIAQLFYQNFKIIPKTLSLCQMDSLRK